MVFAISFLGRISSFLAVKTFLCYTSIILILKPRPCWSQSLRGHISSVWIGREPLAELGVKIQMMALFRHQRKTFLLRNRLDEQRHAVDVWYIRLSASGSQCLQYIKEMLNTDSRILGTNYYGCFRVLKSEHFWGVLPSDSPTLIFLSSSFGFRGWTLITMEITNYYVCFLSFAYDRNVQRRTNIAISRWKSQECFALFFKDFLFFSFFVQLPPFSLSRLDPSGFPSCVPSILIRLILVPERSKH